MCGIAALFSTSLGAQQLVYTVKSILLELQHRGQEASGIAIALRDGRLRIVKGPGLVSEVLTPQRLSELVGEPIVGCIGHVRYSTSGGYREALAQPVAIGDDRFRLAIAFNGNIANYRLLAKELGLHEVRGDAQVLASLIYRLVREHHVDVVEAIKELPRYIIGSYSLVVLTNEPRIIVARDPYGFRPLAVSIEGDSLYTASETAALEAIGCGEWREVGVGEIISFDGHGHEVLSTEVSASPAPCAFEYVYFSRPDSVFNGIEVYKARFNMGIELGRSAYVEADVVIPVPDSGRAAALGFSRVTGIPIGEGFYANKYLGRSFIAPPSERGEVAFRKYGIIKSEVQNRRIVLVDDSIVRGTTMRVLVTKLRRAGARKVHVRIASPPFRYPCFMGIDVPTRSELVAKSLNSVELARYLHADSVAYNSIESLVNAIGLPSLCHACFSGLYPFRGLDMDIETMEKLFAR